MKKFTLIVFCILALTQSTFAAQYKIDDAHSTVSFTVRHILSKVTGRFDRFSGTFSFDEKDAKSWKTEATIEAASINTNNEKRDKHLRTADFFDVDKFKTLQFTSTNVSGVKGKKSKLHGKLTLHGVTKDVVLDLEYLGNAKDPWGNKIASFVGTTTINRKDYGLTWNQTLETGGLLVGEEVMITLEIAGLEQAETPAANPPANAKK